MPTINFVNEKKQVEVPEGENLRKAARNAGVKLYKGIHRMLNCRGLSQCGTCRVLIAKGAENAGQRKMLGINMEKLRMKFSFARIGNEDVMRLACQTTVDGDIDVITKPELNLYGESFWS